MSILAIPISPLSHSKRRLGGILSKEQIAEFTLAMFRDIGERTMEVDCFSKKIVYCNSSEVLEISEDFGFIPIKETSNDKSGNFNDVVTQMNDLIVRKFDPESILISFVDLVLISPNNFYEIKKMLDENQLVICPSVHSLGISMIGRKPPNIIDTCFSSSDGCSLKAQIKLAKLKNLMDVAIYDSFRAGFDVDLKDHLILGYELMKIFKLTDSETFLFLKKNLKSLLEV